MNVFLCLLFNIYYISVYAGHDIKYKKHDNSDFHQIPKTKKLKLAKQETLNCATWFGDKKWWVSLSAHFWTVVLRLSASVPCKK